MSFNNLPRFHRRPVHEAVRLGAFMRPTFVSTAIQNIPHPIQSCSWRFLALESDYLSDMTA
ncbi:hypothetical protein BDR03DRAFT_961648 [Suillus americanus]|nr:hypothetical protein BDR03DRAFT_961648 [Suillus americanus]